MKRIDIATDQRVLSLAERLPDTFYKYMRVDDEQRLEWLRRLLVDGELYFASSAELNDPFECAIAPSFAASEDQILEYARNWVGRQGRDPVGCEAEVRELVARASTEDFQKETERRYLGLTQSYGIASVTTTATNPLMWSYYAAAHTGIVVGIDTMRFMQQPFRAPMFPLDVEYARDFPVANFYTDDDFDIVRKTLGTKSYDWHHEEEWRWILIGKSGIVRVDPRVITTIVCGLRTDGDTEQRIREWIGGRGGVEMGRVQSCGNSFRLETSA